MKKLILLLSLIVIGLLSSHAQWSNDPLVNSIVNDMTGSQAVPHIAYDASGNFYVGFYSNDAGNYDIRLQYYSFDGVAQWASDGILVSNHTQNTWITEWDLKTDNSGNCVMAFNDVRDGNANVYAYAISPAGSFLWGADGIQLTNDSEDEFVPSITVTSSNNAIVAWSRPTSTVNEIVMQKITPAGSLSWGSSGITYQAGSQSYTGARVLGVEGDNYIMGFYKETGSFPALTRHIYVQKFDGSASPLWTSDVLASNSNGISAFNNFTIASDNANGIILAWTDDFNGDNNIDAEVQRVLGDGSILWPANGASVSASTNNSHQNVQILGVNTNDEVLVTWSKKDINQTQTAIAGQKFSSSGIRQWTDNGIEFIPMSSDISGTIGGGVFDGTNALITYDEWVSGSNSHIKAFGVDDAGSFLWTPTITFMAGRSSSKVHITNSPVLNEMLIVVWEEGSSSDIYMQNIYTDGSLGDPPISDDATLSDLTVNGNTVTGFSPDIFTYLVGIPTGDPLPVTGATPNHPAAILNITQAIAVPGSSNVLVTAEDGITQHTYVIDFYVMGTDATLSDLSVDGTTIAGFAPDVFNYDYQVATGNPIPVVGATAADPLATMDINQATALPGAATVVVTSEDGLTTNTYTVNFLYTPGTDAHLIDLLVGGETIEGFDPEVLEYDFPFLYPSPVPYVLGIPIDPLATVDDTQCLAPPCDAILVVTAEDGITTLTYTVHFYYLPYDASLSDLTVDGTTIEGFAPETTYYEVDVMEGLPVPQIDGTPNDLLATTQVSQAPEVPGEGNILVTAQDTVSQMTYVVKFNLITGLVENELHKISIFPNPVSNTLYISGISSAVQLEIVNLIGIKVLSTSMSNDGKIDVSNLQQGIYIVAIKSDDGLVETYRFVKK